MVTIMKLPANLSRISFAASTVAVCFFGALLHGEDRPPNILFILSDDHAAKAVSAYDGSLNRTPHLDRLAAGGMLFRNASAANAICGPSRASILTGKHSHRNGMVGNIGVSSAFDGSQITFPKLLRDGGHQTALIGKWHLRSEPTGFDHWEILIGQGPYYNPPMLTAQGPTEHTGYTTDIITDLCLDWLQNQRDPAKPFLLLKHHKAPHRTWMPGPDHLTKFGDVFIPEPPTLFHDYGGLSRAATMQELEIDRHLHFYYDLKLPPRPGFDLSPNGYLVQARRFYETRFTPEQKQAWDAAYREENEAFYNALEAGMGHRDIVRWKYQRYIKDYLRTVASLDDNIGRILDYLDESGLAENTIVIYASDQGMFLGERGWYDKRWHYEESLGLPLIIRWPGVTGPGSETTRLAQNIDLAPTLLEAAGIAPPEGMQGRSLAPLLRGEEPEDWRRAVYFHYYEYPAYHAVNRHYGLRTDRHKLAYFYELDEWELFDLQRDPHELNNAWRDPHYRDILADLQNLLSELRTQYGDLHSDKIPFAELREMSVEEIARVSLEGPSEAP